MAMESLGDKELKLILLIGFLLFLPIAYYLNREYDLILKTHHADKWGELRRTSFFFTIQEGIINMKFIIYKEYLELNDPELNRICKLIRFYSLLYIFFFLIIIFLKAVCSMQLIF